MSRVDTRVVIESAASPLGGRSLADAVAAIVPVDEARRAEAWRRLDGLTKPVRSLGRLEEVAADAATVLAGRRGGKTVVVFAADHGVTIEGVSAYPSEVTAQMVRNFVAGGAAVNVLARQLGLDVVVVDVGVAGPPAGAGVVAARVRPGTANLRREPAMTPDEARRALEVGIAVVERVAARGAAIVALGEMGIGNTTAAAAVTAALLGLPAEAVVGAGAGLAASAMPRKVAVVAEALALHRPDPARPLDVLAAVGGLEIAALAGACLAAATTRCVAVIDGFIASVGALLALRLAPSVQPYLVFAHRSAERGHDAILQAVGATPLLDLGMRLGEGSGACLGATLVETSLRLLDEMATFESAGVSRSPSP